MNITKLFTLVLIIISFAGCGQPGENCTVFSQCEPITEQFQKKYPSLYEINCGIGQYSYFSSFGQKITTTTTVATTGTSMYPGD